jgi:hypothetical protein
MTEPTLQDVQRHLAAYINGNVSLSEFRDWFDDETWELSNDQDAPLGQTVAEIELRFAEFTNGHRTEDDLRYHLETLLPRPDQVDFQLPLTPREPSVEMISS